MAGIKAAFGMAPNLPFSPSPALPSSPPRILSVDWTVGVAETEARLTQPTMDLARCRGDFRSGFPFRKESPPLSLSRLSLPSLPGLPRSERRLAGLRTNGIGVIRPACVTVLAARSWPLRILPHLGVCQIGSLSSRMRMRTRMHLSSRASLPRRSVSTFLSLVPRHLDSHTEMSATSVTGEIFAALSRSDELLLAFGCMN